MSLSKAKRITIAGILLTGAAGVWGYTQISKDRVVVEPQPENLINESMAQQIVAIEDTGPEIETFSHIDLLKTDEGIEARLISLRDSNQALVERFIEENDDVNWYNVGHNNHPKTGLLKSFIRRNTQQFIDTDIQAIYDEANSMLEVFINEIPLNISTLSHDEKRKTRNLLTRRLKSLEWVHGNYSIKRRFIRIGKANTNPYLLSDNPTQAFRDFIKVNLPEGVTFSEIEHFFSDYETNFDELTHEEIRQKRIEIIDSINELYLSRSVNVEERINDYAKQLARERYNELQISFPDGTSQSDYNRSDYNRIVRTKVNEMVFEVVNANYNLPEDIQPTKNEYKGWLFWLFRERLREQILSQYEEGSYEHSQADFHLSNLGNGVRIQEREESFKQLVPQLYEEIQEKETLIRETYATAWDLYRFIKLDNIIRNPGLLHKTNDSEMDKKISDEWSNVKKELDTVENNLIIYTNELRQRFTINNPFTDRSGLNRPVINVLSNIDNDPRIVELREKLQLIEDTIETLQ